ncbi:Anti-sigma-K factor RskA [Microbacterium sp. ru370.1]|uniref:anti-sigma factor n=1 Tax=unclassified Microbacterium TaxID=2609290 RepID=UPI0008925F46|nr:MULTISPECIES: anti-sigma factor [unclassified Microbacterium]SDO99319.1 Anti-sigma-K factor RskA [Microbacterium sp. ru370.1]SIT92456.1 Anti-sigma-K factor RskA [Microbacterium sp. RU1D]
MNERDFADLAVGHAMNALSEADERAYQEALAGNPHWDHHVRDASDVVAALSASVQPVEPPPSVREALFARISELPQETPPQNSSSREPSIDGTLPTVDDEDFAALGAAPVSPERETVSLGASAASGWGPRRWFTLAASFAAVLVLGFGAVTVSQIFSPPPAVVALEQIEDAPDAQSATATMPDGTVATAHWSPSTGQSVLVTDGMPAPEEGKTYELWFVRDETPIAAGTFKPDADGKATAVLQGEMHSGDVIAVTIEPDGGSPDGTPSTAPVVAVATA